MEGNADGNQARYPSYRTGKALRDRWSDIKQYELIPREVLFFVLFQTMQERRKARLTCGVQGNIQIHL
jgi:hypothetical protein